MEISGRGRIQWLLGFIIGRVYRGAENAGGDTFIIHIALGKPRDLMGSRIESLLRGIIARLVD
ncbi:unnamed protein product [Clonostachys rhizophaga]|uniref:Uncharacterized protein n=1 Tax=Clonostachys rhizophaga TaxID=160324 RepID=A0A9N9YEU2_9HYPO|nr:unnamed protein product [Clonostachys rhizophaga]